MATSTIVTPTKKVEPRKIFIREAKVKPTSFFSYFSSKETSKFGYVLFK